MNGKKRCFPQDVYQSPKVNGAFESKVNNSMNKFYNWGDDCE